MKTRLISLILALAMALSLLTGCAGGTAPAAGNGAAESSQSADTADGSAPVSDQVATASEMTAVEDVVEEGMTPVTGDQLVDGVYSVKVDSSSSMFSIADCQLTVENGQMTAVMTMGGTGYLYLYMGTGEEAAAAAESEYISPVENEKGEHTFTVPVEALDKGLDCAAFSKRKEKWYERTLVFRADSMPPEAFRDSSFTTLESLNLADGAYTVEVALAGGSGKASVESPAKLTVSDGACVATIVWSSSNYDFMVTADGNQLDPVNTEGNSTFEVPVTGFDFPMPVQADTTAMSKPYLIDYTLTFDSASIRSVK